MSSGCWLTSTSRDSGIFDLDHSRLVPTHQKRRKTRSMKKHFPPSERGLSKTTLEKLRSRRRDQAHNSGEKIVSVLGGDLHHESGGPVTFDIGHELDHVLRLGHFHSFVYCRVEKHLLGTRARVNFMGRLTYRVLVSVTDWNGFGNLYTGNPHLAHIISQNHSAAVVGRVLHQTQHAHPHVTPRFFTRFEAEQFSSEMAHNLLGHNTQQQKLVTDRNTNGVIFSSPQQPHRENTQVLPVSVSITSR